MAALLDLIRKLIDYGKDLAATLPQRAADNRCFAILTFGTNDLAAILARISRGLQRADALEARLARLAARAGQQPALIGPAPPRRPRPTRPTTAARASAPPAALSTEEQIAADRRRPIGAVIADIRRDLAIRPNHPLWRELQAAIGRHGGSYVRLLKDVITPRVYQLLGEFLAPSEAPPLQPARTGIGPP